MGNSGTISEVIRRGIVPRRHHDPDWPVESRLVSYSCIAKKDARSAGVGEFPLIEFQDDRYEDESGWLRWDAGFRERGTMGIQLSSVVSYKPKPCPDQRQAPPDPTRTRTRAAKTSIYDPANPGPGSTTGQTATTTTGATTTTQQVSEEAFGLLPLRRAGEPDTRFDKKLLTGLPSWSSSFPVGWTGTLAAGTEEYSQEEIFHPSFHGVVAVNDNGDPAVGTRFFDLGADGAVNPNLSREAQSLVAVLDLGDGVCGVGGKVIALQMGKGGRKDGGSGHHVFVDYDLTSGGQAQPPPPVQPPQQPPLGSNQTRTRPKTTTTASSSGNPSTRTRGAGGGSTSGVEGQVGIGSHYGGGPLRIADCTQHKLGETAQGMDLRPVHLNAQALWLLEGIGDAPFAWDDTKFQAPIPDGPYWRHAYLRHDPSRGHTVCDEGAFTGLFAWQTTTHFYTPDPPPCKVDLQGLGTSGGLAPNLSSVGTGTLGGAGKAARAGGARSVGSLPGQPASGTGTLPGQPATGTGSIPGGVRLLPGPAQVDKVKDAVRDLSDGSAGGTRTRGPADGGTTASEGPGPGQTQGEGEGGGTRPPGKKPPDVGPPVVGQPHWPAYVFGHQCQFGPGYGFKPYATNDGEYALPGSRCSPREIGGEHLQQKFEQAPTCISISGYARGDGSWCGFDPKVQLEDGWFTGTGGAVVHNPSICVKEMVERLDDLSPPVKGANVGNLVIEGTSACLAFSKPSNKSSTGVSGGFALEQSTASGSGLTGAALDADGQPITDAGFEVGSTTFEIKQAIDLQARDLVLNHVPNTAGTNPVPVSGIGLVIGDGAGPNFGGFAADTLLLSTFGVLTDFGAGGGGAAVLDMTLHSFPFGVRRDTTISDPSSVSFTDIETLVHYPGWTVSEVEGDRTNFSSLSTNFSALTFAEELDATSGNRTSYCNVQVGTEEGSPVALNFRTQVPKTFSGWGADGLVLKHRIFMTPGGGGTGSPLDTGEITLEVFDPSTAFDAAEITVLRSKGADVIDDAGYVDLTITKAQLDSMTNPFSAGDMLHIRVEMFGLFGLGADQPTFRIGRLAAHFEGATVGGGSSTPLPCIQRAITSDLTVAAGETCLARDLVLDAGVTITIAPDGELFSL